MLFGMLDGAPSMRVIHADASLPEMCGNGLRCVVLHAMIAAGTSRWNGVAHTDAGPHAFDAERTGPGEAMVTVEMRAASLDPASLPVLAAEPLIDAPFALGPDMLKVTTVSMGNPHVVLFGGFDRRGTLGPPLSRDPRFPNGVNVSFARFDGEDIELFVHERGVGFTEACGTAACATAYAAVITGRAPRHQPIIVRLPGGPLQITVGDDGAPIRMRGPARRVFEGTIQSRTDDTESRGHGVACPGFRGHLSRREPDEVIRAHCASQEDVRGLQGRGSPLARGGHETRRGACA